MKLIFVIPAQSEGTDIGDCLDSILKQKAELAAAPGGAPCEVEIIVVDNASSDGTAAVVENRGYRAAPSLSSVEPARHRLRAPRGIHGYAVWRRQRE